VSVSVRECVSEGETGSVSVRERQGVCQGVCQ
jgi:hypothetical protein